MERREHDRVAADLPAVCRVPASPHRARVVDVSDRGCRIRILDGVAVTAGTTVHLDFGPGRRISGQVMWSGPQSAGVRFDTLLSPDLAIALGLAEAPVVELTAEEPTEIQTPGPSLPHWLRRLLRRAA